MTLARIRGIIVLIQFTITVAIVIVAMYTFKKHVHKIIKLWMKLQIFFLGIKIEEHGKMDDSCDMVIMNHQSLLDIIIIEHLHNRNLAWVGKKEITDLFFFGHIMKAPEMITINREKDQIFDTYELPSGDVLKSLPLKKITTPKVRPLTVLTSAAQLPAAAPPHRSCSPALCPRPCSLAILSAKAH